jgi:hypothetical protein
MTRIPAGRARLSFNRRKLRQVKRGLEAIALTPQRSAGERANLLAHLPNHEAGSLVP